MNMTIAAIAESKKRIRIMKMEVRRRQREARLLAKLHRLEAKLQRQLGWTGEEKAFLFPE